MPNIEIHGFENPEAGSVRCKIFNLFRDTPYVGEMVVTIFPTDVKDSDGKDQPFIRLVNSGQEHTQEILKRLKTLRIDIEQLRLEAFFPAKKKKSPI